MYSYCLSLHFLMIKTYLPVCLFFYFIFFSLCSLAPDLAPVPIVVTETTHQEIFRATGGTLVVFVATGDPSITTVAGVAVIIHVVTTEEVVVAAAAVAVAAAVVMVIAPTTGMEATVTSSSLTSTTAPKEGALAPAHPASAPGATAAPIVLENPLPDPATLAHLRGPHHHRAVTLKRVLLRIQRVRAHQMKEKAVVKKQSLNLLQRFLTSHRANGRA